MGWMRNIARRMADVITSKDLVRLMRGGDESGSGMLVNEQTAMRLATVYACVDLTSRIMSTLPLHKYSLATGERERDELEALVRVRPNEAMTAATLWQMVWAWLRLDGNAYLLKNRNGYGQVKEIWPIPSTQVTVDWDGWTPTYKVRRDNGEQRQYTSREIVHLRGLTIDGKQGLSVISHARQTLGLGLAMKEHGSRYFRNGARPGGVVELDAPMHRDDRQKFLQDWNNQFGGVRNSHSVAIMPRGMKFSPITVSNADAQWLDAMRFNREEICQMFGVPPHMVGILERSTNNNIEQQSIEFKTNLAGPLATQVEQGLNAGLLSDRERRASYYKFSMQGLMRGDSEARAEYYMKLRQMGVMSANEIRALEEMAPLDEAEGDMMLAPVNLIPMDQMRDWVTGKTADSTGAAKDADAQR